jgi:hypothetical protein
MAYQLKQSDAAWVQAHLADYFSPKDWKAKKDKHGATLSKKKGADETSTPYYKLQGEIQGVSIDKVVDVIHRRAVESAKELDPHTLEVRLLENLGPQQLQGIADEGRIYYRQTKLPFVDNRDFLTLCLMRTVQTPDGRRCVAFFSRSVDDYPNAPEIPKGFTRAHVLTADAFVEESPTGVKYTFTNQVDVKMALSKAAQKGTKAHMPEAFERLKKACGGR